MTIIYTAGPYRATREWGITQNIRKAETIALALWKKGWTVICPHKNTAYFGGSLSDETWLEGDLEIIDRCDAMFMVPGWEKSEGSQIEHQRAIEIGMPIYYKLKDVPIGCLINISLKDTQNKVKGVLNDKK